MIDIPSILGVLEQMQMDLDAIKDKADDARDRAEDAENAAYEARSSAETADQCAECAKDHAKEAMDMCDELDSTINELIEELKTEQGHEGEKSLQADIRKWRDRVLTRINNGCTTASTAADLGISEFLIQCILDEKEKNAA